MTLASGTSLGPYQIVAPLGAGGMGVVYLARDKQTTRGPRRQVGRRSRRNANDAFLRLPRHATSRANQRPLCVPVAVSSSRRRELRHAVRRPVDRRGALFGIAVQRPADGTSTAVDRAVAVC